MAKILGTNHSIIGKYERNENLPSIEMVAKMAKAFGVTVERINDIQKMDADTKSVLFNVIDTYIQNFKTKQAFVIPIS